MFTDVKKQAFEQFQLSVNQESIERMADDVHIYKRQSPELDRLEKLAEVFHEYGNPANIETFRTLRNYSLRCRNVDEFMALAHSQYDWFGSLNFHSQVIAQKNKPAFRVVK